VVAHDTASNRSFHRSRFCNIVGCSSALIHRDADCNTDDAGTMGAWGDNTRSLLSYGRGNRVSANDRRAICASASASAVTPGTVSYFEQQHT
jgi:hypothetical protein